MRFTSMQLQIFSMVHRFAKDKVEQSGSWAWRSPFWTLSWIWRGGVFGMLHGVIQAYCWNYNTRCILATCLPLWYVAWCCSSASHTAPICKDSAPPSCTHWTCCLARASMCHPLLWAIVSSASQVVIMAVMQIIRVIQVHLHDIAVLASRTLLVSGRHSCLPRVTCRVAGQGWRQQTSLTSLGCSWISLLVWLLISLSVNILRCPPRLHTMWKTNGTSVFLGKSAGWAVVGQPTVFACSDCGLSPHWFPDPRCSTHRSWWRVATHHHPSVS